MTLSPSEWERVVGHYEFAPGAVLIVERDGAGLKAQLSGQQAFPIFPDAPLSFFLRVIDAQLRFTASPDGKVTGVTLIQGGQQQNGKRITP